LEKYSADAIRIFILSSHYRSPLTYSEEILEAAEKGADRLRQTANSAALGHKTDKKIDAESYRGRFIEAMDDDFNTAQALAALFDLAREINTFDAEGVEAGEARNTLKELAGVMGLTFQERKMESLDAGMLAQVGATVYQTLGLPAPPVATDAGDIIENLINLREERRKDEKWAEADMVRDKLADSGIILEDTVKGTVWKRIH
ncbi:MAG: cysteine--tRNA ligase, partial [Chloroflexi bacterium]|nr:cysteine--tRNA ligase [Chloroflexota bacterium]